MAYGNPDAYEQYMGRWSARLAPAFVRFAGIHDGEHVLDVGCGTGSLTRALLDHGPAVAVCGVDPSVEFVDHARRTLAGRRTAFEVSAAESLPFSDASFDATLALLVLQALEDPPRAIREMARVTRRGGCVATTLWDFAEGMPMISLLWDAAEAVAPRTTARHKAAHPPPRFSLESLALLWADAGLAEVRTARLSFTQEFSSFDDFWLPFMSGATPICEFAVAVYRETGEQLTHALRDQIPGVRADGSFSLQASALAVAGIAGHGVPVMPARTSH
jgi:SAM-dependent methyltransferase